MAQGRWMSPTMGYGMRQEPSAHPVIRVCVDSPNGVTAAQFGRLLVAMEELWISRLGGPHNGALRILEVGTGSVWARIAAESRNAPMATFAAFVATVTAVSPDWSHPRSGRGFLGASYAAFTPLPERKFIDAVSDIASNDGSVDIQVEDDGHADRPSTLEKRKAQADELTKAAARDSGVKTYPSAGKMRIDENKK